MGERSVGADELLEVLRRPVLEAAPRLLGAVVSHAGVSVRLTEVEAYAGADDPGSHAFRGETPRTRTMFGPAGGLYVYFVYGMHHCANVVCGPSGTASAVLLRAGEVLEGHDLARVRRPGSPPRDLARGPARLCRVLGIGAEHDGGDVVAGPVQVRLGDEVDASVVRTGPRVGLREAGDRPWRFWVGDDPTVSAYRPAAARRRGPRTAPQQGAELPDLASGETSV